MVVQTPRVSGTAVFLTRQDEEVPALLMWHLAQKMALHQDLIVLMVRNAPVPCLDADKRLEVKELAPRYWRAQVTFGFMERPDFRPPLSAHEGPRL